MCSIKSSSAPIGSKFFHYPPLPWLDTLSIEETMVHVFKTFVLSIAVSLSAVFAQAENGRGTIRFPENGTKVSPGQWVPFYYASMGEYGVTSYNFTVWLYTSDPREGLFTGEANGISIGTWSYSSSSRYSICYVK